MKNVMTVVMLLALVGLVTGSASAVLVNTTFEQDSPNAGDWTVDQGGPPAYYGVWDEEDIASGVDWTQSASTPLFVNTEAYNGDQCGRIRSSDRARLDFASGENTGTYTATYYAMLDGDNDSSIGVANMIFEQDDAAYAAKIGLRDLSAAEGGAGTFRIRYVSDAGAWVTLTDNALHDVWYKFELVLNYGDEKYNLTVTDTDTPTNSWNRSNLVFRHATANSLDRVCVDGDGGDDSSYWDNIHVTPEPATMSLLLLGLPFALCRRR